MTNQAFYPGDEDQDPIKKDPADDPMGDGSTEEDEEGETAPTPDADADDLLDDDGIVEGEEEIE